MDGSAFICHCSNALSWRRSRLSVFYLFPFSAVHFSLFRFRRPLSAWLPQASRAEAERAAAARGRARGGNNSPFRQRPIWPHPLRRAAGGGAAVYFVQRKKMERRYALATARGAVPEVRSFHSHIPPPARPRDYTPHGARKLTVFGRVRDSALDRPEPPRGAARSSSKAAGAAARADSRGWRVGARSGGSDGPAAAAHVVGEPRVVASGRAGEGARVDSVVRMVECAYVVEHR